MLAGLATSHKIGLALVAGVFIAFALICSFVLPAKWPNFPGKRMGLFIGVSVALTAAMLAAVIALAAEPKEEHGTAAGEETTVAATSTAAATTPAKPPPPAGDAAAGKTLFTAQGCVACHTFKPAGATAKVGPDLDNLAADAEKANRGTVEEYAAESIEDPTAYTVPGYPAGVMPAFNSLSDKQVGDLVAFLTAG
ncbi:MAG TPA: cytochrome c [Gaiellaceae bacterium]|nr:cytochrome c [Gaiellaceae bacterium]